MSNQANEDELGTLLLKESDRPNVIATLRHGVYLRTRIVRKNITEEYRAGYRAGYERARRELNQRNK